MSSFLFSKTVDLLQKYSIKNQKFLLAISGGVDSMVLGDVFYQLGCSCAVAHCHFGLRQEADLEKNQVQLQAYKWNFPFHFAAFQKNNAQINTQTWARDQRYLFFENLMQQYGYAFLVTAHHLDDQMENFLLHGIRGSSLQGVAGMSVLKNQLFRPFLSIPKKELYLYAKANKVPFLEDQSNFSDVYRRNFLRNQIFVPLIEKLPQTHEGFKNTFDFLQEDLFFLNQSIEKIWQEKYDPQKQSVDLKNFDASFAYVLKKKLIPLGFKKSILSDLCLAIEKKQNSKFFFSKTHRLVLKKIFLLIQPLS